MYTRAYNFILLTLMVLVLPLESFGTVEYLCANKYTKELYWAEEGNPPGIIGWRTLPEAFDPYEKELLKKGYTYTSFPCKIEIAILVFLIFIGVYLRKKRKR